MMQMDNPLQEHAKVNFNGERQESTNLISRLRLLQRLNRGRDSRIRFVESHLNKGIAFQLRSLRNREKWSQQELAEKVGMTQNAISRLESSTYGKPTITTLKRLASIYDVALVVRFVPFSHLVDWLSGTPRVDYGLSSSSFDIPAFDNDPGLQVAPDVVDREIRDDAFVS